MPEKALDNRQLTNLATWALEQLGAVALVEILAANHVSARPSWQMVALLNKIGAADPRVCDLFRQILATSGLEDGFKVGAAQFLREIGTPSRGRMVALPALTVTPAFEFPHRRKSCII